MRHYYNIDVLLQTVRNRHPDWELGYLTVSSPALIEVRLGYRNYRIEELLPEFDRKGLITELREAYAASVGSYVSDFSIYLRQLDRFLNESLNERTDMCSCNTSVCKCPRLRLTKLAADGREYTPPTALDRYNDHNAREVTHLEQDLGTLVDSQRQVNANIRTTRAKLASVDDFPKNARFLVVAENGTHVYCNLFKDADGVWYKGGDLTSWFKVYDVFASTNWGQEVNIIQVKPAKTIPSGKDFNGYGAPLRAPAKKTAAKKTATRRPAKKTAKK